MPLSEAQILDIIQTNRALGADPSRVEVTDLAKILDALENDILTQISGSGLVVGGTPATGKVPKWNGTSAVWDTDLTANPGTGGTLDEVLTNGNTTDESIVFDETLTTPTVNGQAVSKTWMAYAPLDKTSYPAGQEQATFYWHETATLQDNAVNTVMHFGWNINAGGGPANANIPGIGESWESNYKPFTNRWVEKHEFYITPNTFTAAPAQQIRLSSYTIDSVTGNIDYYKTLNRFYIKTPYDTNGKTYFIVQPGSLACGSDTGGDGGSTKSWYISGVEGSGGGLTMGINGYTVKTLFLQNIYSLSMPGITLSQNESTGSVNINVNTTNGVFDVTNNGTVDIGVDTRRFKSAHILRYQWQEKAGAPTATEIPTGYHSVYKNTSNGEMRLWANDGGTLKSVLLS